MTADGDPWFVEAFRADYRRVYPHRDLAAGRAEVAHLLARGLEDPLLDLCCGFGRHTLALREAGRRAFGLDLSADLLGQAEAQPGGALLAGRLARGDARRLPFRAGAYRSVVLLFSSFGYFEDGANAGVLAEVARILAPGGQAAFDLMNPARIRAGLVPRSRTERDGVVLVEERRLSDDGRRVVKDVRLEGAGVLPRSWREDVRLYEPAEFDALCARAGLAVVGREGDFGPEPFSAASPRQIVWTRRD